MLNIIDIPPLNHQWYDQIDDNTETLTKDSAFNRFYFDSVLASPSHLYSLSIGSPLTSNLNTRPNVGSLARLPTRGVIARHCGALVMQTLRTYPEQMLRRHDLPLFIHPQWHLSTLPEPLAVCMKIAQMFASRTPEVMPFIWRTIRAEQVRCIEEV